MDDAPQYYQPPEHHKQHFKQMYRWLILFFGGMGLIALLCIIFANSIARKLPFSVEKRFVKPYEVMADRWFGDHLGDEEVEAYLTELVTDLAEIMDVPESYELSVHFVDSAEANAFATLGGHMVILGGIFDAVEDENSLAMILAHELSHIKHRDPLASMGRGVAVQMMLTYFTGNSSHSQNLANMGGQLGLLSYSREQEERCDLDAVHALNAYYGHVAGYDRFFAAMIDEHGPMDDSLLWLQSHPDLEDRIANMQALIEAEGYSISEAKPIPEAVTKKLSEAPAYLFSNGTSESSENESSSD